MPTLRKQKIAFQKACARCKVNNSIKVTFTVEGEPVSGEDVFIRVVIDRNCTHNVSAKEKTADSCFYGC